MIKIDTNIVTFTTATPHGFVDGDMARLYDVGDDNPLHKQYFYVSVIDSSTVSLYRDSSLTIPFLAYDPYYRTSSNADIARYISSSAKIAKLSTTSTSITYQDFPAGWRPQKWSMNSWKRTTPIYYDGYRLGDWTNNGVISYTGNGNPTPPSYLANYNTYAYLNIGTSLSGKTISFNVQFHFANPAPAGVDLYAEYCTFSFGTDSSGAGPQLQLARFNSGYSSNIVRAKAWNSLPLATSSQTGLFAETQITPATWHAIKIVIDDNTKFASWYCNGVLQDTVPVNLQGTYIGIQGACTKNSINGVLFDEILITGDSINTDNITWVNSGSPINWTTTL